VAVASAQTVTRLLRPHVPTSTQPVMISSLQVGIQGFNQEDGAGIFDVTSKLTSLGLDLRGDAVAIARTGFESGSSASIALATTGSGLTMLRFSGTGKNVAVEDVSAS